jgi:putative addiction module component (TIGR02574 family)
MTTEDGMPENCRPPSLEVAQQLELERRLADHMTNPDDVVAWEQVKAEALARFSR